VAGGWQQQLAANLQQLAASSSGLPQLEQHLMQSAVQSVAWAVPGVVQSWSSDAGNEASTSSQQLQPPQQQQAPGAAPQVTQQQQQQQAQAVQEKAEEAGDATTHGVVLIAGFLEAILKLLLEAAGRAAAQQAGVQLGVGQQAGSGDEQQQQQGASVFVTARHVLLGVAGDADLSSLLLNR
jgi:hypothetical protein